MRKRTSSDADVESDEEPISSIMYFLNCTHSTRAHGMLAKSTQVARPSTACRSESGACRGVGGGGGGDIFYSPNNCIA
jgi:hypothetical protein